MIQLTMYNLYNQYVAGTCKYFVHFLKEWDDPPRFQLVRGWLLSPRNQSLMQRIMDGMVSKKRKVD